MSHLRGHAAVRTAELDRIRAEFFAVAPHGGVDERQFGKVLSDLGFKDVPVHRLFTLFDTNRDNLVDFKELLVALSALHSRGEEGLKCALRVSAKPQLCVSCVRFSAHSVLRHL